MHGRAATIKADVASVHALMYGIMKQLQLFFLVTWPVSMRKVEFALATTDSGLDEFQGKTSS